MMGGSFKLLKDVMTGRAFFVEEGRFRPLPRPAPAGTVYSYFECKSKKDERAAKAAAGQAAAAKNKDAEPDVVGVDEFIYETCEAASVFY